LINHEVSPGPLLAPENLALQHPFSIPLRQMHLLALGMVMKRDTQRSPALICASFAARAAAKMVGQPAVLFIGDLIKYVLDAVGHGLPLRGLTGHSDPSFAPALHPRSMSLDIRTRPSSWSL
jgi:hypothetical protein